METKDLELFTELKNLIGTVAVAQRFGYSKSLYDLAGAHYQGRRLSICIVILNTLIEIREPFYTAQALLLLSQIYREIPDRKSELSTYELMTELPEEIQKFIEPEQLGLAYEKLGLVKEALQIFRRIAYLNQNKPNFDSNFAELLLLNLEFQEAAEVSTRVATYSEPRLAIMGRLFRGAALWFLGRTEEAAAEFHGLCLFLISSGGTPPVGWDFRDSKHLLQKINSQTAQLLFQLLEGQLAFDEFRRRWIELESATPGMSLPKPSV